MATGQHFDERDGMEYRKVAAVRLTPLSKRASINLDGEIFWCDVGEPSQMTVLPSYGRILAARPLMYDAAGEAAEEGKESRSGRTS